jgi:monoamine oxidase
MTSHLRGTRVIVVGAGLAGLTAARDLGRAGAEVRVIESRERLGGRVWTLRDDDFSTEPVEAGGEFIDGDHTAIRQLARELDVSLVRVIRSGFGLALETDAGLKTYSTQSTIWQGFRRALKREAAAFETDRRSWNGSVAAAVAQRSLDALLRARNARPEVRAMAAALRGFFLADSDVLSALVGVELSMEDTDPGDVPLYRVRGGNDLLINALARNKNVTFSLRRAVKHVEQTLAGVNLAVVETHGQVETLRADYAVVTVPPPVLRTWTFAPALPFEQRRAVDRTASGPATKALLRFDTRWWRAANQPRAFATNLPIGALWEATENRGGPAILTLLAGGRASEELQEILENEGGGEAVANRLWWLGTPSPLRETRSMTWERDRWAKGGYAFFSASFEPSWRDDLARAFGRIVFAGDHTSREWQGYMNGAVESGQRAAKEVAALHDLSRA